MASYLKILKFEMIATKFKTAFVRLTAERKSDYLPSLRTLQAFLVNYFPFWVGIPHISIWHDGMLACVDTNKAGNCCPGNGLVISPGTAQVRSVGCVLSLGTVQVKSMIHTVYSL
jgi:hypothetical protein